MLNRIKIYLSLFCLANSLLCIGQNSEVFDFIIVGQKMEVIKKNEVSKESLSFDSPIDSLKNSKAVVRKYGKDGRETSNTYLLGTVAARTYTYEYSTIYSKVKVCSSFSDDSKQNCYDLYLSENDGKIYKNLNNGFTPSTYSKMSPPFDIDKKYKPIVTYYFIENMKSDSAILKGSGSKDKSIEKKRIRSSSVLIKEETSYKKSTRRGKSILSITTKQWRNKKRNKKSDRSSKIEFDPVNNQLSFYVDQGKNEWILEKVQSYNDQELFIRKEVFPQLQGMILSENLILKQGDHYKMEVIRSPEGLARKIHEYVNDQLVYITSYDYEFYD
jgi:hypothetical protein